MGEIYLDHNATTPPDPRVVQVMLPYLGERFGNPASAHARGRAVEGSVDTAREQVAALVNVAPNRVVWTSGATEAINQAVKSAAASCVGTSRSKLVCSSGEHRAVLDTAAWCAEAFGMEVAHVPLLGTGEVDYNALAELVDTDTALVAVMAANNETGVLNDIDRVSSIAHAAGSLYFCDATQQAGKLPLDLVKAEVDCACLSAHKLYGPQGVGALITPTPGGSGWLEPLVHGGGHQGGLRSGTLNVAGIVGFGEATRLAAQALHDGEPGHLEQLRERLEKLLDEQAGPTAVHGRQAPRLPNTSNVRISDIDADALIVNCPDVSMSSGSACTAAVPTTSHVLKAMGVSETEAEESVRLSLGRETTESDVDEASTRIGSAVQRLRGLVA